MSPLRVLRGLVFGAFGGALGWALIEFLPLPYPFQQHLYDQNPPSVDPAVQALLGLAIGGAIGGCLGISEGLGEGTVSRFRRAFWSFLLLGAAGGFLGLFFGQVLFAAVGGKVDVTEIRPEEFLKQLFARSLGWMLIGFFLGAAFGVPNLSWRRAWNGALGGAIGGFLAGFFFRVLEFTRSFGGLQLRLLGLLIVGACIGFFINLVVEAMKQVWVKVLVGRNEGREHVLDTPIAYVGRDELADVPVFLDPAVPKRMASFRLTNGRYALYPESDALPIFVNGQPLSPGQILRDGDAIQFGRVTLAYYEKATATGAPRPVDSIPLADFSRPSGLQGATPIPTAPGVCEFCGQRKDPATGLCACAVAAEPVWGPPPSPGDAFGMPSSPGWTEAAGAATMAYVPPVAGGFDGVARLVGIDGPYAGHVFPLAEAEIGIGRETSQTIALSADSAVSRRHARLYCSNGDWILRDEGSSNGTWINGVRVQEQPLVPGDVIRFGQSQFRFEA